MVLKPPSFFTEQNHTIIEVDVTFPRSQEQSNLNSDLTTGRRAQASERLQPETAMGTKTVPRDLGTSILNVPT